MKKINFKNVSSQTWARTVVLLIALINQALVILGITNREIDINSWASYVSYAFTVISALWSWWKNNSFTDRAQEADKLLNSSDTK